MSSRINDLSMGALVLGFDPAAPITWHILLINQKTEAGGYWGLPKGHPENSESPEETAVREVNEECGTTLTTADLIPGLWADEHYSFLGATHADPTGPRVRIDKRVRYGLAVYKTPGLPSLKAQAEEVTEAVWLPLDVALPRLKHEGVRRVVRDLLKRYFISVQTHAAMVLQFPVWPLIFND
jgi:8-oxo-dGTP pyrophosphatase MutT (NUDIX family)